MNSSAFPTRRRGDRISLDLSAVVRAKENNESYWKETTDLISVSRSGAGFYLNRKCDVGQLVSMILPMPRHLRVYDLDRELYRVWGLIQHCNPVYGGGQTSYHVGIAFIGRSVPPSYHQNHAQSYRIAGMNDDGTWNVVEAKRDFVVRRHPRFLFSLSASVRPNAAQPPVIADEQAVTENVSLSGAAIRTTCQADVGDSLMISIKRPEFSSLAIVRHREMVDDSRMRIHVEFVGSAFPIVKLHPSAASTDDPAGAV